MVRLSGPADTHNRHKVQFPDQVREVIRISDVVLEIMDARYVSESRVKDMEDLIAELGKELVHVVTKIDLISKEELDKLKLRDDLIHPVFVSVNKKIGINDLRKRIRIMAKKVKDYEIKHIGVVGYPNVGKSSLLNILARKNAALSSSHPGLTKSIGKIRLAKGILLLDAPGVIPKAENLFNVKFDEKFSMMGVHRPENVKNPEFILMKIMKDNPGVIEDYYKIAESGDTELVLLELGMRWKLLKKGGVVDDDKTSRRILKDWQDGKIKH